MKQLCFGFPIAGILSKKWAYPVDTRVKLGILSPAQLLDPAFKRSEEMDASEMPQIAAELRKEACEQSENGRLSQRPPVDSPGSTITLRCKGIDADFRFAVTHGDKVRAFGGLRRPLLKGIAILWPPLN